jgi:hypothetical protein
MGLLDFQQGGNFSTFLNVERQWTSILLSGGSEDQITDTSDGIYQVCLALMSASFGTKRPRVRIPPARPFKKPEKHTVPVWVLPSTKSDDAVPRPDPRSLRLTQ